MNRDLRKAIEKYKERLNNYNKGAFYVSDIMQIKQMAEEASAGRGFGTVLYEAINLALSAGYEIGHRSAERDLRLSKHNI